MLQLHFVLKAGGNCASLTRTFSPRSHPALLRHIQFSTSHTALTIHLSQITSSSPRSHPALLGHNIQFLQVTSRSPRSYPVLPGHFQPFQVTLTSPRSYPVLPGHFQLFQIIFTSPTCFHDREPVDHFPTHSKRSSLSSQSPLRMSSQPYGPLES